MFYIQKTCRIAKFRVRANNDSNVERKFREERDRKTVGNYNLTYDEDGRSWKLLSADLGTPTQRNGAGLLFKKQTLGEQGAERR